MYMYYLKKILCPIYSLSLLAGTLLNKKFINKYTNANCDMCCCFWRGALRDRSMSNLEPYFVPTSEFQSPRNIRIKTISSSLWQYEIRNKTTSWLRAVYNNHIGGLDFVGPLYHCHSLWSKLSSWWNVFDINLDFPCFTVSFQPWTSEFPVELESDIYVSLSSRCTVFQLAAAVENLKHIFTVPETVERCEKFIAEGKLLHAHKW